MDLDSRIALCGENGSGKSTFVKILVDDMAQGSLNGHVTRNNRLRIGYFSQHHVDTLDVTKSAVVALQQRYYPKVDIGPEAARNHLGGFGITGQMALEPLYCLSGGQKTRVALAIIAYANPHILIMDEPTNHLDMDAVQALVAALSNFKGGVMLVSHDFHTLKCVCDEVWHAENGTIAKFPGDIDEYKKYIKKRKQIAKK
jgi:ATP-binding cassette subfamily F protein 3